MPTISYFYGIYIRIYADDHNPPHFHAKYNDYEASIEIESGAITGGKLPLKARALTEEWRLIHQKELLLAWELMIKYHKIKKIPGLK